jgi:hypothetical protein
VVTFNHDLLIENALATLPRSRATGIWCFPHAYGWPGPIDVIRDESPRWEEGITGVLKSVWDDAATALSKATSVIFWGYSFPRADLHARYFFSAAANLNEALRKPVLINPDPQAEDEIWHVLQPERVTHYRDVEAYLAGSA